MGIISIAVLFIAAVIITFEIIRALSRGVRKSVITLVSVFISTFLAILITFIAADPFINAAIKVLDRVPGLDVLYDRFPHFEQVAFAYADALISPILFVMLFIFIRLILAIVFAIVFKVKSKRVGNKEYEDEDAPAYKKKPRLISAIIGTVSGFLVSVILFTPVIGTLKIATVATTKINESADAFTFRINAKTSKVFKSLSNDIAGNVFYYAGGVLIYKSTASSTLNDNHFELESEIANSLDGIDDLLNVGIIVSDLEKATPEQKDSLLSVGEKINSAETLKNVGADFINDLSAKWLKDGKYYEVPKPKIGTACSMFFDRMLYVCTESTTDSVGDDVSTLLAVFLIADENKILNCEDYKTLIEISNNTGAFNEIKAELEKNPRMKGVSNEVDTMAIRAVASAITQFTPEQYESITTDVVSVLNDARKKYRNKEERIDYITAELESRINDHDIDVGEDIAREVSEKLVSEILDTTHKVKEEEVIKFWDKHTWTQRVDVPVLTPENGNNNVVV